MITETIAPLPAWPVEEAAAWRPADLADADHPEELDRALVRCLLAQPEVEDHGFGELQADGEHRIERCHGFLEHHRDLTAAHFAERLNTGPRGGVAVKGKDY